MSLSKSHVPSTKASLGLKDAFIEVCENSFFAYVEPLDLQRFAALVKETSAAAGGRDAAIWLKSAVAFHGSFAGAIEVILPEPLASGLVVSMLGEGPDATLNEHQMFDGVGEFTNMLCGAWLTNLSDREAFELRAPVVTRMAAGWTPLSDASWRDDSWHVLSVNDQPIRIRFRQAADRA
jgi:hypothetical protein